MWRNEQGEEVEIPAAAVVIVAFFLGVAVIAVITVAFTVPGCTNV